MDSPMRRRDLIRLGLYGLGGVVLVPALGGLAGRLAAAEPGVAVDPAAADPGDFTFVQISDVHLGFAGPKANPGSDGVLAKVVSAVNALPHQPDFVVFTGDLTHTIDDDKVRRERLLRFKAAIAQLAAKEVRLLPGEHDAALDLGAAYREVFGPTHYSFDHKGVHFIALDNVSDPKATIGAEQLAWLKADLQGRKPDERIVVFTHRPLFPLFPAWEWHTADGQAVLDLLAPFAGVTVFYGHIHQEHHVTTGHIQHVSSLSPMYALPAPGSVPKKAPIPWDPAAPFAGLGWREVAAAPAAGRFTPTEHPLA